MQAVTITQITAQELEKLIENSIRKILSTQPTTQHPDPPDQLLTVQQAAEFLTLSIPTIYGLISKGAIPCMKRSKRVYFSKAELLNYLQQGKKKTLSEIDAETDRYLNKLKKKEVRNA